MTAHKHPETAASWSLLLAAMTGGVIAAIIFLVTEGVGGSFINLLWHWAAGAAAFASAAAIRNRSMARA